MFGYLFGFVLERTSTGGSSRNKRSLSPGSFRSFHLASPTPFNPQTAFPLFSLSFAAVFSFPSTLARFSASFSFLASSFRSFSSIVSFPVNPACYCQIDFDGVKRTLCAPLRMIFLPRIKHAGRLSLPPLIFCIRIIIIIFFFANRFLVIYFFFFFLFFWRFKEKGRRTRVVEGMIW